MKFQYRGPLKPGSPLFQGRRDETNILLDACQEDVKEYQIVYGGRQSGLTSLLLNIRERLPQDVCVCSVDFKRLREASTASTDAVIQFLTNVITTKIIESTPNIVVGKHVPLVDKGSALLFDKWISQLPLNGRRLVLLIEELGCLSLQSREDLGNILRVMFEARFGDPMLERTMVILFGGIELLAMFPRKDVSPLISICNKIFLSDLSLNETIQLLQVGFGVQTLEKMKFDFDVLGHAIYNQVEGHPYLSQRLAELLLNHILQHNSSPDHKAIEKIADWLLKDEERHDNYFGKLYDTIRRYKLIGACQRLLSAHLPYSGLDKDMVRLRLIGVAKEQNGQLVTRSSLLKRGLERWLTTIPVPPPPIPPKDLRALIDLVTKLSILASEAGRRAVIIMADLTGLLPSLNLAGATAEAIPSLIWSLEQHGRVSGKSSALGLFLDALAKPEYTGIETREFLQDFINRYHLL